MAFLSENFLGSPPTVVTTTEWGDAYSGTGTIEYSGAYFGQGAVPAGSTDETLWWELGASEYVSITALFPNNVVSGAGSVGVMLRVVDDSNYVALRADDAGVELITVTAGVVTVRDTMVRAATLAGQAIIVTVGTGNSYHVQIGVDQDDLVDGSSSHLTGTGAGFYATDTTEGWGYGIFKSAVSPYQDWLMANAPNYQEWVLIDPTTAAFYEQLNGSNAYAMALTSGAATPQALALLDGLDTVTLDGEISTNAPFIVAGPFTLIGWVNVPVAQNNGGIFIGDGSTDGYGILIGAHGGGTGLELQGFYPGVGFINTGVPTLSTGVLYQLAMVYDDTGPSTQLYLNGAAVGSPSALVPNNPSNQVHIVFNDDVAVGWVQLSDQILSPTAIAANYAAGSGITTVTLELGHIEMVGLDLIPEAPPPTIDLELGRIRIFGLDLAGNNAPVPAPPEPVPYFNPAGERVYRVPPAPSPLVIPNRPWLQVPGEPYRRD